LSQAVTPTGQLLYRPVKARSRRQQGSSATAELARGQEPQIRPAVDVIYPTWLLLDCLKAFAYEQPDTRIELYETVLGGVEALIAGAVDLAGRYPTRQRRSMQHAWARAMHGFPRTLSVPSLRRRAVRARCTPTHNERARAGGIPDA
jgi:hypothetical protein